MKIHNIIMNYEAYYNNNEIKKLAERYPVKGDSDMWIMLVNWMIEDLRKS